MYTKSQKVKRRMQTTAHYNTYKQEEARTSKEIME